MARTNTSCIAVSNLPRVLRVASELAGKVAFFLRTRRTRTGRGPRKGPIPVKNSVFGSSRPGSDRVWSTGGATSLPGSPGL